MVPSDLYAQVLGSISSTSKEGQSLTASMLVFPGDCMVLKGCIEGLLKNRTGPIRIIETGVCDGGSAFYMLTMDPRVHVMSYSFPGNSPTPWRRSREDAGKWARVRMTDSANDRWMIVHEDSTQADWVADLRRACQVWNLSPAHSPDLIFLDGDHNEEPVYRELIKASAFEYPVVVVLHDWDNGPPIPNALARWAKETGGQYAPIPNTKMAIAVTRQGWDSWRHGHPKEVVADAGS